MSKTTLEMIARFGREVEAAAGEEARQAVMSGSQALTPKTGAVELAQFMKGAVDRLDAAAGPDQRASIMDRCGTSCAQTNSGMMEKARARRLKFTSEEAFLQAELKKEKSLSTLEREGEVLYQTYTPQNFSRPARCFCGLMRDLPAAEEMSPTYCLCSAAFVRTYWETVLGRPVSVEIIETALSGSTQCRFKITPSH